MNSRRQVWGDTTGIKPLVGDVAVPVAMLVKGETDLSASDIK